MTLKKALPQIKEILKMMSVEIHTVDKDTIDFKFHLMPVTDKGDKLIALIPSTITVYCKPISYITLLANIKLTLIDSYVNANVVSIINDYTLNQNIVGNFSVKDSDILYYNKQFLCDGGLCDENVCHGIMIFAISDLTFFIQEIVNRLELDVEQLPFIHPLTKYHLFDDEPTK